MADSEAGAGCVLFDGAGDAVARGRDRAAGRGRAAGIETFDQRGLLFGLGETKEEIGQVMDDLRVAEVDFSRLKFITYGASPIPG